MKDAVTLSAEQVFDAFETSPRGLTSEEAARRLAKYGPNVLVEKKQTSAAYKLFGHLRDLFNILLLLASLLAALASFYDPTMLGLSIVILAVVAVNTVFSLFQEWRAERAMETLRRWMP